MIVYVFLLSIQIKFCYGIEHDYTVNSWLSTEF